MSPAESHEDYRQLLRLLAPMRNVYVMGGFAEDALLEGSVTQDRSDIDLLVQPGTWEALRTELASMGIDDFAEAVPGPQGEPLAYTANRTSVQLEAWQAIAAVDSDVIILLGGPTGFFRTTLPADTFAYPRTSVDGIAVQTVSPAALYVFRAVSAQTRGDERRRAADRLVLDRLAALVPGLATAPPEIAPV
jgi:hypothetical protein